MLQIRRGRGGMFAWLLERGEGVREMLGDEAWFSAFWSSFRDARTCFCFFFRCFADGASSEEV